MRPRHKAAEYHLTTIQTRHWQLEASMRPRHKAAEYRAKAGMVAAMERGASMRPRHKAAEYGRSRARCTGRTPLQ